MKEENEDTFLARWMIGDSNKEDLERLKNSGDEKKLSLIINEVDSWTLPPLKENTFEKISARTGAKVIPLYQNKFFLFAASLLLIVGLFFMMRPYFGNSKLVALQCEAGETKTSTLPDGSSIMLIGKSSASYYENDFTDKREIKIEGAAYFEVTKAGKFKVNFDKGNIEVLGTKFRVTEGKAITSVSCFEGKVKVSNKAGSVVLTHGEATDINKNQAPLKHAFTESPSNKKNEFNTFDKATLEEVINSMATFYDVEFDDNQIDLKRNYSGEYQTNNLDTALKLVFTPMSIRFEKKGRTIVLTNEN